MNRFTEFCSEFGIRYAESGHHHCRPGWIQIDCPFCGGGRSGFHLGYSVSRGTLNCWRCGSHSIWDTIATITGQYPKSIIQTFRLKRHSRSSGLSEDNVTRKYNPPKTKPLSNDAQVYLEDRGFDPDEIQRQWQIESTLHYGSHAHRIFIPVWDSNGNNPVSFTTRATGDDPFARYKSAKSSEESVPLNSTLYGEWAIPIGTECVVVCEGPTDVWRLGTPAVATFGSKVSIAQVRKLQIYPLVAICFDSDSAGQKGAIELSQELNQTGTNVILMQLIQANDYGSIPQEDVSCFWEGLHQMVGMVREREQSQRGLGGIGLGFQPG